MDQLKRDCIRSAGNTRSHLFMYATPFLPISLSGHCPPWRIGRNMAHSPLEIDTFTF